MPNSIDLPPLYDIMVKKNGDMSDLWIGWFSLFIETLIQYLSQFGIFIPQVTTDQMNAMVGTTAPVIGQVIYNTDTNTFMGYQLVLGVGTWKTFTTS